jgi:hypothetical protein
MDLRSRMLHSDGDGRHDLFAYNVNAQYIYVADSDM